MKKFLKWLDEDFEECVMMILLVLIAVVMMLQIICRTAGMSLTWPEEFSRICYIWTGFISIGYCISREKMLKVDILVNMMPKKIQIALDFIGRVICLLFFAYLTKGSYGTLQLITRSGVKTSALMWPMAVMYLPVTLGAAIAVIRQLQDLYRFIKKNFIKKEAAE